MEFSTEELTAKIEDELREVMFSRDMALYQMMTYHFGWHDRYGEAVDSQPIPREHGLACIYTSLAMDGDLQTVLPAAASIELTNSFIEIHDDVQDGNPDRYDREAVWWVWGPAQAINAGDGLHALARLSLFRLQEHNVSAESIFYALKTLDKASLMLCEGRFKDLEAQERIDLTIDEYLLMASRKTGALYSCAMKLGGFIAEADEEIVGQLGTVGEKLGVAVQISNELKILWGESSSPQALNKTKLLAIVHAMENGTIREKRRLGDIYFKRVLEQQDVVKLRAITEDFGSKEFCEGLVNEYRDESVNSLQKIGLDSKYIVSWIDSLLS